MKIPIKIGATIIIRLNEYFSITTSPPNLAIAIAAEKAANPRPIRDVLDSNIS